MVIRTEGERERERPLVSGEGCTQISTTNQRLEDLTVTTTTHIQAKWILLVSTDANSWRGDPINSWYPNLMLWKVV